MVLFFFFDVILLLYVLILFLILLGNLFRVLDWFSGEEFVLFCMVVFFFFLICGIEMF